MASRTGLAAAVCPFVRWSLLWSLPKIDALRWRSQLRSTIWSHCAKKESNGPSNITRFAHCAPSRREGGRDLDLCVDSLEMGEKEAWSTRLASHQRGVIYGVAETGVPGPVSQWGSAKGERLGKSENPTSPTIPMLMCPSIRLHATTPLGRGGECV